MNSNYDVVDDYRRYVEGLGESDMEIEIEADFILIDRDKIADQFDALTSAQRETVRQTDELLRQKANLMAYVLPSASSTEANRAAGRWWWFLHEGQ